jgi:hypothetical protein
LVLDLSREREIDEPDAKFSSAISFGAAFRGFLGQRKTEKRKFHGLWQIAVTMVQLYLEVPTVLLQDPMYVRPDLCTTTTTYGHACC